MAHVLNPVRHELSPMTHVLSLVTQVLSPVTHMLIRPLSALYGCKRPLVQIEATVHYRRAERLIRCLDTCIASKCSTGLPLLQSYQVPG